jgi:hypothetical protein
VTVEIAGAEHHPHETVPTPLLWTLQTFLAATKPFRYVEDRWVKLLTSAGPAEGCHPAVRARARILVRWSGEALTAITDVAEYAHLSAEEVEALAVELDAIRLDIEDSRGAADRAYIQRTIAAQRCLDLAARRVIGGSRTRTGWVLGTLALAAGQEHRKHGAGTQYRPRPMGLDERPRNPLHHLGVGHRGSVLTMEVLPQLPSSSFVGNPLCASVGRRAGTLAIPTAAVPAYRMIGVTMSTVILRQNCLTFPSCRKAAFFPSRGRVTSHV